jgi:hypothetical protein
MDWCVAETFNAANHNPIAAFNNNKSNAVVNLSAKSGQTIKLNAAGTSDPDRDNLNYHWFCYKEAGDYNGTISIQNSNAIEASFTAPKVNRTHKIHIILEVKDNGKPNLYSYRRVIVTTEP